MPAILAGIGWHMVGAASAASFYAPIEKVKRWSWETTWAVAGIFSWVLLPIGVSYLLLPHFGAFYASIPSGVLLKMALFGAMWGVGNVSYGLTMRHLGMSLGIGVAIGVTLVVGTLVPPLMHGQAAMLFQTRGGLLNMAGVLVALAGRGDCVVCGAHERDAVEERRAYGVQRDAGAGAGGDVRDLFFGNVVCDGCGAAYAGGGAAGGRESALFGAAELCVHHGRRRGGELCAIALDGWRW